jgi:hypothetical protein
MLPMSPVAHLVLSKVEGVRGKFTQPFYIQNVVAQFIGLSCRSDELALSLSKDEAPMESGQLQKSGKGKGLYEIMRRTIRC